MPPDVRSKDGLTFRVLLHLDHVDDFSAAPTGGSYDLGGSVVPFRPSSRRLQWHIGLTDGTNSPIDVAHSPPGPARHASRRPQRPDHRSCNDDASRRGRRPDDDDSNDEDGGDREERADNICHHARRGHRQEYRGKDPEDFRRRECSSWPRQWASALNKQLAGAAQAPSENVSRQAWITKLASTSEPLALAPEVVLVPTPMQTGSPPRPAPIIDNSAPTTVVPTAAMTAEAIIPRATPPTTVAFFDSAPVAILPMPEDQPRPRHR
ncbi:hypothetical protein ABZP36_029544 [Zizania latifolia]